MTKAASASEDEGNLEHREFAPPRPSPEQPAAAGGAYAIAQAG
jgi:hypothetical protein